MRVSRRKTPRAVATVRRVLGVGVLTVVLLGVMAVPALADVWNDITDAQWLSTYGVTAQEAATVAQGYPDGSFGPYQDVTRGQFAKMVVSGLDIPLWNPAVPSFSDVPRSHIFYQYVEGGVHAGVISGYGDGRYGPDDVMARQQTNSILGAWLAQQEIAIDGAIKGSAGTTYPTLAAWYAAEGAAVLAVFADQAQISSVHRPGTAYLVARNVVQGSTAGSSRYLAPLSPLTRAQSVTMILRTGRTADGFAGVQVLGVTPAIGPTTGGTLVTVTGTGFVGVTAVKFGTTPASSFSVVSPLVLTVVAPAHAAGTVDVVVTAHGQTSPVSAADRFVYAEVPTITGLVPAAGQAGGGNSVVITGTGFTGVSGAAAVKFGTKNATSYVVNSATQITAVAPSGTSGSTVDVVVTNEAGPSVPNSASKYSYGAPTVSELDPAAGPAAGGNSVVITGTGFTGVSGAAAVKFGTKNATSYVVNSATQITAVAPSGVSGTTVDVVVTTPAGSSATSYDSKYSYGIPVITALDPTTGPTAGGNSVVITGTGFTGLSGAAAVKFGANNATSYTVNSPTQITAVAPSGVSGTTVDVVVTTPAGSSATSASTEYSYGQLYFVLTGISDPITAGTASTVKVTVYDETDATVTAYRGTVYFSSTDPVATLPPNYKFTSADAGTHTFTGGVTLKTAGSQTVTVTDASNSALTGSKTVTVNPGAATKLEFASAPSSVTAGTPFSVTVKALDTCNNIATGYLGKVHFTSSDPTTTGVVLPADYTFTAADAGIQTFTDGVTLITAGSRTLTVSDTAPGSTVTPATKSVTVNPGALHHFAFDHIDTQIANVSFPITIRAYDQYGNLKTDYAGTATLSVTGSNIITPTSAQFTAGVSTLNVTITSAQPDAAITATAGSVSNTSNTFVVGSPPV